MPPRETGEGDRKGLRGPSDHTENTPGCQSSAWAEDLRDAATARGALGTDTWDATWDVIRLAHVAAVSIVNLQERL